MVQNNNIKSHLHQDLSFQISSSRIPMPKHIYVITFFLSGAVVWVCFVKKVFLKTLQNLQENTCVGVSFLIDFNEHLKSLRTSILWNICKTGASVLFNFVISISINAFVKLILNMIIFLMK